MKATFYRLGEHRIIQAGGTYWWEAHAGVGAFKSGRCFLRDNILLLGPSKREEPGYLKREFIECLRELPQWDLTRYYCSNYSIRDCRSGRKLKEKELSEWAGNRTLAIEHTDSMEWTPTEGPAPAVDISYQLGQYEVTRKTNGQCWWMTYAASDGLCEGRCVVEGGILFLGAGEKKEDSGNLKHTFFERLSQLPQWSATKYYCPSCAVYDCRTGKNLIREEAGVLPGEARRIPTVSVFIPPASAMASSTPLPRPQRPSSIDSTLSLLKEVAGKAGRAAYRKIDEAVLKYKLWRKSTNIKSGATAPEIPVHRFPVKKWIAWSGAFILMIGLLLLALFHDLWENWERHHRNHDHSTSRHRDH